MRGFGLVVCVTVGVFASLGVFADSAQATYSIAAVDRATKQVGGSGTSCVNGTSVRDRVYGVAPGFGVIHAQAQVYEAGRKEGVGLLKEGKAPAEILAAIEKLDREDGNSNDVEQRQYGIVDLTGRAIGSSGEDTLEFSDHRTGAVGDFTYAVQGNILTSVAVLDQSEAAFRVEGCDLADKLMLALEAGADNGEGDSRCTGPSKYNIPSDSAFIRVDLEGGQTLVNLEARYANPRRNPLPELRRKYDEWRTTNPCPGASGGGGDNGGSGGGAGSGGSSSGSGGNGSGTGGTGPSGNAGSTGGDDDDGPSLTPDGGGTSGCSCALQTTGSSSSNQDVGMALGALFLAASCFVRRSTRRRYTRRR